ncbi:hypothetical protein DWY99_13810 [[Clostridium] leptum]|uniref:Uncharacterized protein n=1 Tax=[Clostridium] leptum TaxID=1535 RepID=A0A412ASE5_9FIRM|nr:hypothetical protein DWY99_13810 [[Clostridium] leptum]
MMAANCTNFKEKILANIQKKSLQLPVKNGIIIERDCDRYAMKREVAAVSAGFSVEYVRF